MAGFAKNTGWTSAAVNWPNFSMGGVSYDIRWTAPFDTTITVGGDVWMMRDDTNPSQQSLTVLINGVSQGAVNIDKASRAQTPETFQTAYNNVSFLQNILVLQGQTLDFRIGPANISQMPDFVGIDLVITGTDPGGSIPSAPEPGTIATLVGGLGIVALYRRRRA